MLTLYFVLTTPLLKTLIGSYKHAVIFKILFVIGKPEDFQGELYFLKGNLNRHILGTKGRRKLKFGEAGLQICQKFLRENLANIV